MPFAKGQSGNPKGRVKGKPNKDTAALADMIKAEYPGWDPVLAMAEVANDTTHDIQIRMMAAKEVAQYLHPKRKAIDITTKGAAIPVPVLQVLPLSEGK